MSSESYVLYAKYKLLIEVLNPLIKDKLDNEINNLIIDENNKITYKDYVKNKLDNIIKNIERFEKHRFEIYDNFNNKYNKIIEGCINEKELRDMNQFNSDSYKEKLKYLFISHLDKNDTKYKCYDDTNEIEILNNNENDMKIKISFGIKSNIYTYDDTYDDTYNERCFTCSRIKYNINCQHTKIYNNRFRFCITSNEIKEIENTLKNYMDRYKNFNDENLIESLQLHKNLYDLINIYVQLYWNIYKYKLSNCNH